MDSLTGRSILVDTVNAYRAEQEGRLDESALKLLLRLAESADAAEVFAQLKPKLDQARAILITCIEAEELARSFFARIEAENAMLVSLDRLNEEVERLRRFVEEQTTSPSAPDALSARIYYSSVDLSTMKRGLYLVADLIAARRRIANETRARFGASRKSNIEQAGENSAIQWIVRGMRLHTGQPNNLAVVTLAKLILRTEISEDRVEWAARKANQEWRKP